MDRLPILDYQKEISIILNLSTASSPGQVYAINRNITRHHWFEPRGMQDLPAYTALYANDTSLGTGYAPFGCNHVTTYLFDFLE